MDDLVSVIIPVYNVEKYLDRCVGSMLRQTYDVIEIILVDDGSTDSSPGICDRYAEDYSNVRVIHQKNGGLSAARNTGIEHASGEWISLMDSDDYVSESFVEELLGACKNNACDCAVCAYVKTTEDDCDFSTVVGCEVISGYEAVIQQMGYRFNYLTIAPNKLYKRELFEGVQYPLGLLHEDVHTTHELLYRSGKVALIKSVLMAYYQSPDSIMRNNFSVKRLDALEAFRYRISYYQKKQEEDIVKITYREYCERLLDTYWVCKRLLPEEKAIHKELRMQGKSVYSKVRKMSGFVDLSWKKEARFKLKLFIGRYMPLLYREMFVEKGQDYI